MKKIANCNLASLSFFSWKAHLLRCANNKCELYALCTSKVCRYANYEFELYVLAGKSYICKRRWCVMSWHENWQVDAEHIARSRLLTSFYKAWLTFLSNIHPSLLFFQLSKFLHPVSTWNDGKNPFPMKFATQTRYDSIMRLDTKRSKSVN